jgi:hypothetical protein
VAEQFRALHADLVRGIPSITCGHYSTSRRPPSTSAGPGLRRGPDEVVYPSAEAEAATGDGRELFLKL